LDYYYQLERRISSLLGCKVDIVPESVRKQPLQEAIDRARALAF
jgi:hypothetical protein